MIKNKPSKTSKTILMTYVPEERESLVAAMEGVTPVVTVTLDVMVTVVRILPYWSAMVPGENEKESEF